MQVNVRIKCRLIIQFTLLSFQAKPTNQEYMISCLLKCSPSLAFFLIGCITNCNLNGNVFGCQLMAQHKIVQMDKRRNKNVDKWDYMQWCTSIYTPVVGHYQASNMVNKSNTSDLYSAFQDTQKCLQLKKTKLGDKLWMSLGAPANPRLEKWIEENCGGTEDRKSHGQSSRGELLSGESVVDRK